jgi:tetratricopeptide (TPR) repeat protein
MRKPGWVLLIVLASIVLLVLVAAWFWPWLSGWLPHSQLIETWITYLVVDLNIGRWGPVATLLLVALIELVWALNLGRRSEAFDSQWDRLEQFHAKEIQVLNQEIALLKDERRTLRAELELREDLIREEKARLWEQLGDLSRSSGDPQYQETGAAILRSPSVMPEARGLSSDMRGEWRQTLAQLERIEMIGSVSGRKGQSALQQQQHADELLRLGNLCYQLGHYERALAHYNRAIESMPNKLEALVNRAVINEDLGRHQAALQDLERALKLGENPWAYLYRGLIQERLGEDKRAQENYTKAIRQDSAFVEGYYRRGLLYAKIGECEKAIQDETRVLELGGDCPGAYTARGVARAALGDTQRALNDLDRGCTLAPHSREAFYHRGIARHLLGMYQEARVDFDRAIELDPLSASAYMARGNTHRALEDYPSAIADYDRTIELEPKNATAYHARGRARAAAREYGPAAEDYSQALELDPGLAEVLADRGAAYEKLGEHDQAIQDLDRSLALDPSLAIAYYARGLAYGSKGEYNKASRDLNRAVELDPSLNNQEQALAGTSST